MNSDKQRLAHGLSDGRGMFWALRSLLVPGRNVDFVAEKGIFEPAVQPSSEQSKPSPTRVLDTRKTDRTHQTYLSRGQVIPIYTRTLGTQFAAQV